MRFLSVRSALTVAATPPLLFAAGLAISGLNISAVAVAQDAAKPAAVAADAGKNQHYSVAEDREFAAAAAATEKARIAAWRKGDARTLDALTDSAMIAIDGFGAPNRQYLDKAGFLSYLKATRPAATVRVSEPVVRLFAWMSDVAVVNGTITDSARPNDPGMSYSAIYVQLNDEWQIVRYITTPLGRVPFPKDEPAPTDWSVDSLSATQARAFAPVRNFLDYQARRDFDPMEKALGPDFWAIHPNVPSGPSMGRDAFVKMKRDRPVAPELVGLDKPDIQFFGNYGDVAIVTGIRRDATGGAIIGSKFTPGWRSVAYYITVVERDNLRSDNWTLQHYHATYINPDSFRRGGGK